MNIFHFHSPGHLGDNVMNLKYFSSVSTVLKKRNVKICYYYNADYIYNRGKSFLEYVDPVIVELKPLHEKPPQSVELWMGIDKNGVSHREVERYYEEFYKEISTRLYISDVPLNNTLWLEDPTLLQIYDTLDPKFKDIEILILNNKGMSGQFDDNTKLNELSLYLNTKFNVVTTWDIGIKNASSLSLKEIGAMSTRAKYIIGPHSGPLVACLNSYAKAYVKKWFFVGNVHTHYSINNVQCKNDITPIKEFFDGI